MGRRKAQSDDEDDLPNGQLLLLPLPEPTEGQELLMPADRQRELYPLTTVEGNQERLQAIVASLAADAPVRYICRTHRVGWHTLQRIREAYGPKIATLKQGIAKRMALFIQLGIEQLLDDLAAGAIAPDKLGIIVGIISDKMQVLTGEPSAIIGAPAADARRYSIEALRERLGNRPVIDVSPAPTGSEGAGKGATREGALEAGSGDQAAPSKSGSSDSASEVRTDK